MNRYRSLIWPGYLVAACLIFIPIMDVAISTMPPRLGEVGWRLGAVGLFSRATMTPLLGLFIALLLAIYFEQQRVVRGVAILTGLAAIAIIGVVVMFGLDALQMRRQVRPQAKSAFDIANGVALFKYFWAWLVLTIVTVVAWKTSRVGRAGRGARVEMPLIATTGEPAARANNG
jgi:hypothetical protein